MYREKVMAAWPNLKAEWAEKYAQFLEQEVASAVAEATQPLQARTAELEAELGKATGALDYERQRCDVYAAKNTTLTGEVASTRSLAENAARVAAGIPVEDIDGVLTPGKLTRVAYIGAIGRVSQWLDALQAAQAANGPVALEQQVEIAPDAELAPVEAAEPVVEAVEAVAEVAPESSESSDVGH